MNLHSAIPVLTVMNFHHGLLARYPNSKNWVDFEDFAFYRMEVMDVYYVGGFGVMGWVSASEYYDGKPDPLADVAADIVQHMNADHGDALRLLARTCAGIESQDAAMTSVDRLGFHVRLKTADCPWRTRGKDDQHRIIVTRGSLASAKNLLSRF